MTTQATAPAADAGTASTRVLRRAVLASALGNATEWYDYGVYAYVTTEIGKNFFHGSVAASLLTYAVSFVLRPLGGIVWGPLGDRLGRQRVLAITILMMSVGTFLVGILPTYGSIGVWAPTLLIILRMLQGFSTGGEYGGAATFMAEYAPDRKRGFWGSFLEFGTLTGMTVGASVSLIMSVTVSTSSMNSWGWRIPFLIGLPLGTFGLYLRLKLEDTPVFRDLEEEGQVEQNVSSQFKTLFLEYWKPLLRLAGMVVALNIADYTLLTYMPTYLQDSIHLTSNQADLLMVIGQILMMLMINSVGRLSDRVGRKPCWWISLIGLFALSVPMFMLMRQGLAWAIVAFVVLGVLLLLQLGTISATFPAMFPSHLRYSGMAIAYNISTALFGGTADSVNNALIKATHNNLMPAFYVMAACIVGAAALVTVPETVGCSLRGRKMPVSPRLAGGAMTPA